MFKRNIFIVLLTICSNAALAQTVDCFKYKEGRFRIIDPNAGGVTIIDRKGGYQTESNEGLKIQVRFTVTWQDDCTYMLKIDKILRNENKVKLPSITLKVKIVQTGKDNYVQESSSIAYPNVYRSTVTRINN